MLNFHFEDEEMKSLAPENISSECWGLDLRPLPCDSKAGLFALLSLSANTEEGTWLGRELPGSWFPKAVGVTFPWGSIPGNPYLELRVFVGPLAFAWNALLPVKN